MKKQLNQINGLSLRRKFEINPDTLSVDIKTDDERTKGEVSWLQIGFEEKVLEGEWTISIFFRIFMINVKLLFFAWAIVFMITSNKHSLWFYLCVAPIVVGISAYFFHGLVKKEKVKKLIGDYEVTFRYLSQDEEEVDQFIEQMKIAQASFLRRQYRIARAKENEN